MAAMIRSRPDLSRCWLPHRRQPVTYDRLLHADREPQNWLTYSGKLFRPSLQPAHPDQPDNVKYLQMKWVYHPLYTKNTNTQNKMENTPLVVDGIMYTGTALEAVALDAVTGRQYWKLPRPLDPEGYYNAYEVNKGMAIAGDTLFWATVDCHLLAIDTKTGQVIWDKLLADFKKGYQYNVAPLDHQRHGDPRAGDQRSGRQLLGRRVRRQNRQRTLAVLHRTDVRRRSPRRKPGRAIPGSTAAVRSGTRAATTRKPT